MKTSLICLFLCACSNVIIVIGAVITMANILFDNGVQIFHFPWWIAISMFAGGIVGNLLFMAIAIFHVWKHPLLPR